MKKFLLLLLMAVTGAMTALADDYVELLTNGACDGTYNGWEVTNDGDGWGIYDDTDGSYLWASSYEECRLEQTVILSEKGFSNADIDAGKMVCKASAMIKAKWDPYGSGFGSTIANVYVEMLDGSGNVLSTITVLDNLGIFLEWTLFETDDFTLVSGTRKLNYVVRGQDRPYWGGQYGPAYKNLSLKVKIEGTHDCNLDGHVWGEWTEATAPTCTEDGTQTHTCLYCGESESRSIPALGHIWGEDGVCTRCGVSQDKPWGNTDGGWCGKTDVNEGKNVYYTVTQSEDNQTVLTIKKNPNAVGDNCDIADYNYTQHIPQPWGIFTYDEYGCQANIPIDQIVIEEGVTGLGARVFESHHEVTAVIPSTVIRIGYLAFRDNYSLTDVYCHANPNNLTWDNSRVKEFKGAQGSRRTQMHVYPEHLTTYQQKFGDANVTYVGDLSKDANHDCNLDGHVWGEWKYLAAPTCTEDGTQTHTCIYCGESENQPVPALGHAWNDEGVCSRCGLVGDKPWGNTDGGWCGRLDVNGGANVYYTRTLNENRKYILTFKKNPKAIGDNCDIRDFDIPGQKPQPWADVSYQGAGYAVSSDAHHIVIEEGVTGIGTQAFWWHLETSVVIPSTVTRISQYAFRGNSVLEDVYCLAAPNNLTWGDSRKSDFSDGIQTRMHVFSYHLATYQQKFGDANVIFVGDLEDFLDGIKSIPATELGDGNWYDLSGRKLDSKPTRQGLYIVNGKKIAVK